MTEHEQLDLDELASNVADSLWLSAVASAVEQAMEDDEPGADDFGPGPGGDWADTDYKPVPESFEQEARKILAALDPETLERGRAKWLQSSGMDDERFAHVLAMAILGSGVGLFDDVRARDYRAPALVELDRALPCLDCSGTLVAFWNPETGRPEPA